MAANGQSAGSPHMLAPEGGGLISTLSVPIGMIAEYKQHRKDVKKQQLDTAATIGTSKSEVDLSSPASTPSVLDPAPPYPGHVNHATSIEDDQALWGLDDAAADHRDVKTGDDPSEQLGNEKIEDLVQNTVAVAVENPTAPRTPLPCPVIIPQRRPQAKTRGFLRAYAPALDDCGLDQATFLAFLKNFHKASQAWPVFDVLMVATGITSNIPSQIAMGVSMGVQAAALAGKSAQTRQRTNNFLDRTNQELFRPLALYAMIVKFKSDAEMERQASHNGKMSGLVSMESVDLNTEQSIAKYNHLSPQNSESSSGLSVSQRMQNMRGASMTAKGSIEIPAACPLIFPDLDNHVQREGPEKFKDKAKDAQKFMADYMDRRARLKYAKSNPDSALAIPEEQRVYGSKFSDPSNIMYSGGFKTLITGLRGGDTVGASNQYHAQKREEALNKDVQAISKGKPPKESRGAVYGQAYYDELFNRTSQYREKAIHKDVKLISHGKEPTVGQDVIYGEAYYDVLFARVGKYREKALQHDSRLVANGKRARSRQDLMYGPDYYDLLAARTGKPVTGAGGSLRKQVSSPSLQSSRSQGWDFAAQPDPKGVSGVIKTVRRKVQEDVLYLMIVNMPTESELAQASAELGRA